MNSWFGGSLWEIIPILSGMSQEIEIFGAGMAAKIGAY
jgi:hypothetical protein